MEHNETHTTGERPLFGGSGAGTPALADACGRRLRYLRLSITKACGMRCIYCRPEGASATGETLLSASEIGQLVAHLVGSHGIRKVRLTGGEPTVRDDLPEIIARLARLPGLDDLALTTNGLTLARQADELARAGLRRVNVSLDSLDPATYRAMTGVDGLNRTLAGIDAALRAGLAPLKINVVVVRGRNDAGLPDLLRFAASKGLAIRFIELMPMGPLAGRWAESFVSQAEMRERLAEIVARWTPLPGAGAAACRYRAWLRDGSSAEAGFIPAMTHPFCAGCDRLRIAADGALFPCLMDGPAGSLLPALRPVFDPLRFDDLLRRAWARKRPEHPAAGPGVMTHIGG